MDILPHAVEKSNNPMDKTNLDHGYPIWSWVKGNYAAHSRLSYCCVDATAEGVSASAYARLACKAF